MSLIKHAKRELELAGLFDKDSDYGGMLGDAVVELMAVFSKQGHSGHSAGIVSNLFDKLSRYKNITPLNFKDEEWNETGEASYQNNRRSSVFKDGKDGLPYFIDAYVKIAKFPDGHTSGWGGSLELENGDRVTRCYIKDVTKMPTVKIELDVVYYGDKDSDWDFVKATKEQLKELKKYYDLKIVRD